MFESIERTPFDHLLGMSVWNGRKIFLNLIGLKIGREWNNRLASRIEIKAGADVNILYALSPKFLFWA